MTVTSNLHLCINNVLTSNLHWLFAPGSQSFIRLSRSVLPQPCMKDPRRGAWSSCSRSWFNAAQQHAKPVKPYPIARTLDDPIALVFVDLDCFNLIHLWPTMLLSASSAYITTHNQLVADPWLGLCLLADPSASRTVLRSHNSLSGQALHDELDIMSAPLLRAIPSWSTGGSGPKCGCLSYHKCRP